MIYDELYKKYQKLLIENERLRKENRLYRERYGEVVDSEKSISINVSGDGSQYTSVCQANRIKTEPENNLKVNKNSTRGEKLNLFKSLFAGRNDVYAHRWKSKAGKSGYSPVCTNEWVHGLCQKPKIKCANCKYRKFATLSDLVIESHLTGKEIIGTYPMLPDDTCKFLVIDFDDGNWQEDVTVVRKVCTKKGIPVYVERSRSGNGAHMWFFFNDKIEAAIARKFGTVLLTYSMNERHEIGFESYDRLFPNQDTMPKGGFGNLIALPLQKSARLNGNSLFVDGNFEPYKDQWEYLYDVKRLKLIDLEKTISDLSRGKDLGNLEDYSDDEKPWEKSVKNTTLSLIDFPERISVVKANMLYVKKEGISQKALNQIKRLAAFKNPEFYKAQAMRLPIYNKPRVIAISDETEQYICIPRGCEEKLNSLLDQAGVYVEYIDERNTGKSINVEFNGQLREEQKIAVQKLLEYDTGILSATTAFGKTVIGARLISERKVNTLILVHTRQLLDQWKERLKQFLIINEELTKQEKKRGLKKELSIIGQIGGGKNNANGIIDIAVMQSLVKKGEVKELVKDYGMVIVDECHHVAAFSYEQILKSVFAKFVYGLTATPIRQDGQHPITFMCCGNIRYSVNARLQAEQRPFEHYVIPRITPVKMLRANENIEISINEVFANVIDSQIRNNLIVEDIISNIKEGRNLLVLTERTEHIKTLHDMLENKIKNIFILTGRASAKKRKEITEELSSIADDENVLLIATGKYIGEGFDYPRLDTLLLTFPISWKGRLHQYAGRLHRLHEGKKEVYVFDYVDIHVRVLEKMYQKRLKGYASIGYKIKSDMKDMDNISIIFDNTNFLSTFISDIAAATQQIDIVSPFISKRRTAHMLKLLAVAIENNVKVNIVTRPIDDFKEKDKVYLEQLHTMIEAAGINIVCKRQIHQKFAVIDNRIVWYGSINFFSYGQAQESVMRLFSLEIANELLNSIT